MRLGDAFDPTRSDSTINNEVDYDVRPYLRTKKVVIVERTGIAPDLEIKPPTKRIIDSYAGYIIDLTNIDQNIAKIMCSDNKIRDARFNKLEYLDKPEIGDEVTVQRPNAPEDFAWLIVGNIRKAQEEAVNLSGSWDLDDNDIEATWTEDAAIYDQDKFWSISGTSITILEDGWYDIKGFIQYVTDSNGHIFFQAPSGGIPARIHQILGDATCEIWTEDANGQIQGSGVYVTVKNWATTAICVTGDRYGVAIWINDSWYAVAQDCDDQGSGTGPLSGQSTFNNLPPATDENIGPLSTTTIFQQINTSTGGTGGAPEG